MYLLRSSLRVKCSTKCRWGWNCRWKNVKALSRRCRDGRMRLLQRQYPVGSLPCVCLCDSGLKVYCWLCTPILLLSIALTSRNPWRTEEFSSHFFSPPPFFFCLPFSILFFKPNVKVRRNTLDLSLFRYVRSIKVLVGSSKLFKLFPKVPVLAQWAGCFFRLVMTDVAWEIYVSQIL